MAAVAVVLIVFSLVFSGATVIWLAFALALGFVGVAVAGMTLHEIANWRSAHELGQLHRFVRASQPAPNAASSAKQSQAA